jgi:hypothetical protein
LSAERAFADDVALAELRARAGDGSNSELRSYVAAQLAATRLALETVSTPGVEGAAAGVPEARSWSQLVATAPGASPDLFVLVARLGSGPRRKSRCEPPGAAAARATACLTRFVSHTTLRGEAIGAPQKALTRR